MARKAINLRQKEDKNNIGYAVRLGLYKSEKDKKFKNSENIGRIFEIDKIEERQVHCPRGKCVRTHIVFNVEGLNELFEFEYVGSKMEMKQVNDQLL